MTCCAFTQQRPIVAFRLEGGQRLDHAPWRDSVYLFPSFQEGSLNFTKQDGHALRALYNYNTFLDRIEVIGDHGDTVPIKKSTGIQFVNISDNIFYNHKAKGFVEIRQIGKLNIGIRHSVKVFMESGTGERFEIYDDGIRQLTTKYDRIYTKERTIYFLDQDFHAYPSTLHSLIKLLPKHEDELTEFFKKNKLDIRREDDLLSLLRFCKSLN